MNNEPLDIDYMTNSNTEDDSVNFNEQDLGSSDEEIEKNMLQELTSADGRHLILHKVKEEIKKVPNKYISNLTKYLKKHKGKQEITETEADEFNKLVTVVVSKYLDIFGEDDKGKEDYDWIPNDFTKTISVIILEMFPKVGELFFEWRKRPLEQVFQEGFKTEQKRRSTQASRLKKSKSNPPVKKRAKSLFKYLGDIKKFKQITPKTSSTAGSRIRESVDSQELTKEHPVEFSKGSSKEVFQEKLQKFADIHVYKNLARKTTVGLFAKLKQGCGN